MKDGKITLNRAVKCYKPYRITNGRYFQEAEEFRKKNGFSYEEVWNLDAETAYFILIRLVQFRRVMHGYPCSFKREEDTNGEGMKRWKTQIDKMIRGFYLYCTVDFPDKKQKKIINHGLKLFVENFESLWD